MNPQPLCHVWNYTDVDRAFWDEHFANWLPHRIFDAHTHITEPKLRRVYPTEEKRKQYWVNEVVTALGTADADRCHKLVFPDRDFSCLAIGSASLDFDIEGENESLPVSAIERGWHCLVMTRPQWSVEEVAKQLDKPGVVGVKVYYSLIDNDPTTRDKYLEASIFDFLPHHQLELLNRRRSWITLHVPKAGRLAHPANIAEVREIRNKYPDITLVIAHLGRCYTLPFAEEAFPQLADDQGLFFDTSAVLNPEVHRLALETFGPKRLLYGSDNPVFYMRGRRQFRGRDYINRTNYPFFFNRERESADIEAAYTLYMYEDLYAIRQACDQLGLQRGDVEQIFAGNAERLIDAICL